MTADPSNTVAPTFRDHPDFASRNVDLETQAAGGKEEIRRFLRRAKHTDSHVVQIRSAEGDAHLHFEDCPDAMELEGGRVVTDVGDVVGRPRVVCGLCRRRGRRAGLMAFLGDRKETDEDGA